MNKGVDGCASPPRIFGGYLKIVQVIAKNFKMKISQL